PRSVLTALRSRVNAPRFAAEFGAAIVSDFEQYYAISRQRSNVTAAQFEQFCRRVGAELKPARPAVRRLFDEDLVEAVYGAGDFACGGNGLGGGLRARLDEAGIEILTRREAVRIAAEAGGRRFRIELRNLATAESEELGAAHVFNCTYSRLNEVLARS